MAKLTCKLLDTTIQKNDYIVVIPSSVIDDSYVTLEHIALFKKNLVTLEYDTIPFIIDKTVINNAVSEFKIIPNNNLDSNQIYIVRLHHLKAVNDSFLENQYLKFFVNKDIALRNYNDVYNQINNLDKLTSIDTILNNGEYLNYTFNPSIYDPDTKTYNYQLDGNLNAYKVTVNNTDNIRNRYINQYLYEHKNYFNDIINRDSLASSVAKEYSDDEINKLNLLIFNNITKLNALKGNETLIEYVMGLYSKILGYQLISIIEDRSNNFVYRISTSIPKEFWNKNIKPIVHPCGWSDIYNQIDSVLNGWQVDFSKERLDFLRIIRETFRPDCVSYQEADYYKWYTKYKDLWHLYGNIEIENVIPHEQYGHEYCKFKNHYDHKHINYNWAGEHSNIAYYQSGIYKELYDYQNYIFNNDRFDNKYSFEYKTAGIAIEYIWKTYNGNTLIKTDRTPFNKYSIDLSEYGDSRNFYTILELKHFDWSKSVFLYTPEYFHQYKSLILSHYANQRPKFSRILASNLETNCHDAISFDSFNSNYNYPNISQIIGIQNYKFFNNSINTITFKDEFDPDPGIFSVSMDSIGSNQIKLDIGYKKPGIASKYIWKIIYDDELEREVVTYHSNFELVIDVYKLDYYKVYLSIILFDNDREYVLDSYLIFSLRYAIYSKGPFMGLKKQDVFFNKMIQDMFLTNLDDKTIDSFISDNTTGTNKSWYELGDYPYYSDINDIKNEFDSLDNFETIAVTGGSSVECYIKYKVPSIAIEYEWKIYSNNILINNYKTYFNNTTIFKSLGDNLEIELTLINNEFKYTLENKLTV